VPRKPCTVRVGSPETSLSALSMVLFDIGPARGSHGEDGRHGAHELTPRYQCSSTDRAIFMIARVPSTAPGRARAR
jgi:hypothetical protein